MRCILVACLFAMMVSICNAADVKTIENPKIDKIQTSGDKSGQVSTWNEGWFSFTAKDKKELDKTVKYLYKIKTDPKAVLYVQDETLVGVKSPKFGNFGSVPPKSGNGTSKPIIATVSGCDFKHGNLYCGVESGGKNYYLDSETSTAKNFFKLSDNPGRKVKIVGKIDGEIMVATSITFLKK